MIEENPYLRLFPLILVLLAVGCRESKPEPPIQFSMKSAPTPTPNARAVVPAHPKPHPDPATLVPVKSFQVQPPAVFSGDQVSAIGAIEFMVSANAGQVLHVTFKGSWYPFLSVVPPDSRLLIPGGDNEGNRLYALPETGTYRVVAERTPDQQAGDKTSIAIALLNIDDPLVDPGIRPEDVSIDFGQFAGKEHLAVVPYSNFEGYVDDPWPSHLGLQNRRFEFRIMPVAPYKRIFKNDHSMEALERMLERQGKESTARGLPYEAYEDAGLNFFTTPQFSQGSGWHGLRWIASYGQDTGCWFDDLIYVFEGISDDGGRFIFMRSPVSNPSLSRRLTQDCTAATTAVPVKDMDRKFEKEMTRLFDKALAAADPASFQQTPDQLDTVVRSLKIK